MAIIATGSKTIIDLSDGKSLSVYLGSNQPRTQILDVNTNAYAPDWTTTAGKLVITPVIYANHRNRLFCRDTELSGSCSPDHSLWPADPLPLFPSYLR